MKIDQDILAVELIKTYIIHYFDDKKKSICILSATHQY